ncbi:MAG: DUF971 domain-containing protein [Pseudomonadota bacterium]|nr:DUF971 domain-containing protein [Pseudomonadota bacterium]
MTQRVASLIGPSPESIRLRPDKRTLAIKFQGQPEFDLTAEFLRVESPSAEVQGHSPSEKKIISGRKHVAIMEIEPVGNYAIRLIFDDLHDTGIYSWSYLYQLGRDHGQIWNCYLEELEKSGLSRDP